MQNDLISRQAVLDLTTTIQTDDFCGNEIIEVVDVDDVKALPSVTPQPKIGRWIAIWDKNDYSISTQGRCSRCKQVSDRPLGNFCKWCGAKMEAEE